MRGRVTWFSDQKGYGSIKPDGDSPEVLIHYKEIKSAKGKSYALEEGDLVEFEVYKGKDGLLRARNVCLLTEG